MMLLDLNYVDGFEIKDFSENTILEYLEKIKENYDDRQKNTIKSAVQYLENAFPEENNNICSISIPMLIYLADVAEYEEISPRLFRDWWTCYSLEAVEAEKIKGRNAKIVVMSKWMTLEK